jgi:hypothetical protein
MLSFSRRIFIPSYVLNTALCQSPPGANKTTKSTMFIRWSAIASRFTDDGIENGTHHVTLISTNRNLEETKMWKLRTKKDDVLGCLKILVLSSKKGDINTVDQIVSMIAGVRNATDLPDIIIFCTHKQRIDDIIRLVDILNEGNINLSSKGVHQITATVMFDEADKNVLLACDFLKALSRIRINYTIRDIHFITATPFKEFWKILSGVGIKSLDNINNILRIGYSESEYREIHMTHNELLTHYRKISDHEVRYDIDDECEHPYDYAALVIHRMMEERRSGKRTHPLIVFAPAGILVKSHLRMKDNFKVVGFAVAVHNGTSKGFYYPDGTFETFDDFNSRNGVTGELRDTLVKWRELNPTTDLAITGYLNIERGITFCTIGFNFTDFIISDWHMKNLASLIQLLGRSNGGIKFVERMIIWSRRNVIAAANEQIAIMNNILSVDPEKYIESDFRKMSRSEIHEQAGSVPVIIQLTKEEYESIGKVGRSWNIEQILQLIAKYDVALLEEIKQLRHDQITQPETDVARKKHIDDLVAGERSNFKKIIGIKKQNKHIDLFQIYMDKYQHRLIVLTYYGSRLPKIEITSPTIVNNDNISSETCIEDI